MKDPFRVNEKVVHDVSFYKLSAGTVSFEVGPYVNINGRKSYNFISRINTYPGFSKLVYAADDYAENYIDYEELVPWVYSLHIKESSKSVEARCFFDFNTLLANFWEKKVTAKNGVEERKLQWKILPYSQNIFSAIYYMRVFQWRDNKEYAFRMSDDQENLIIRGKVVRRETLQTKIGAFPAIVIKPEVTVKGKSAGDFLFWLSDDDRKLVLRIETNIKIGTLVSEIVEIQRGNNE